MKFYSYAAAMAVAAAVTFSGLRPAYGELVFEDDLNKAQPAASAPALKDDAAAKERGDVSKAEQMRRQRLREELKNEDLLTQKLEELRLKDEMKRTNEIIGSGVAKDAGANDMQEQRVGSAAQANPATAQSIQPAPAGQANPAVNNVSITGAPVDSSSSAAGQSVANAKVGEESSEDSNRVGITPRFGTASVTNSIYDVSAKFATGLGISVDVSDYIAFTGGYTYASYSLSAGNSMYQPMGFNSGYLQSINMNDNVIDLGARAYLLGPKSKVRPFVGAGGAYRMGYVNYDDKTQAFMKQYNPYAAQDVSITGFAGYIETGLDFKVSKAISITGSFRYFDLLSYHQSNPLDPNAFLNANGYQGYYGYGGGLAPAGYYGGLSSAYGGYGYTNDTRAAAGDALAKNNFYQLMVGVTVSF